MIALSEEHKEILDTILSSVPYQFYIFGSRAKGTAKPFSDLDLAVAVVLSDRERTQLETLCEESHLPFKVDIIELPKISDTFRQYIQKDLVLWKKN